MKEKVICYQLKHGNKFADILTECCRAKVKKCEQMLLFIAMHYREYTSLEVKFGEDCSSSSQRSSYFLSSSVKY